MATWICPKCLGSFHSAYEEPHSPKVECVYCHKLIPNPYYNPANPDARVLLVNLEDATSAMPSLEQAEYRLKRMVKLADRARVLAYTGSRWAEKILLDVQDAITKLQVFLYFVELQLKEGEKREPLQNSVGTAPAGIQPPAAPGATDENKAVAADSH